MVDKKNDENVDQIEESAEEAPQTISLFLAIGLVIGALIVGLVIGYVAAPSDSTSVTAPPANNQTAPPLTPDQADGGQLPPGHPQIPGDGGTGAGSAETTPATPGEVQ